MHGWGVIPFHICTQELATLRETDGIKPSAKLRNRGQLLSDDGKLLVDIPILGIPLVNELSLVNTTLTNPAR